MLLPHDNSGSIRPASARVKELNRGKRPRTYAQIVDATHEEASGLLGICTNRDYVAKHSRRLCPSATSRHRTLIINIELHSISARLRAVNDERDMVPIPVGERCYIGAATV